MTGLIIPGFEVDVSDPDGPTTFIGVRNVSDAGIAYFGENADEPPLRVDAVSLAAGETRSIDVRSNLTGLDRTRTATAGPRASCSSTLEMDAAEFALVNREYSRKGETSRQNYGQRVP